MDGAAGDGNQSFRKKGTMNTRQATRKKMLPVIAQKLPKLATTNEVAESMNNIQPRKSI